MAEMMIGTSAYATADTALLREAGIGWVRQGVRFPFVDSIGGTVSEEYLKSKAAIQRFAEAGTRVMVNTPNPGIGTYEPDAEGKLVLKWHDRLPAWCGPVGSEQFLRTYEEMCAWLAQDLKGLAPVWQIANELDIQQFAGPLNPRQACDLIAAGARGLKSADRTLVVGHNPAGGVMDEEEARRSAPVCAVKKWRHTWGAGHTPEGQAQFIRTAFEAFRSQREHLLGVFFYRWED